jgi:hypothetical protein
MHPAVVLYQIVALNVDPEEGAEGREMVRAEPITGWAAPSVY